MGCGIADLAGGVYKRPKLNIFGFSFCPQGPGLESRSLDNKGPGLTAQGTWTRGAGTLTRGAIDLSQGPMAPRVEVPAPRVQVPCAVSPGPLLSRDLDSSPGPGDKMKTQKC